MSVSNLIFHIEEWLDMFPVKLQGCYGTNLLIILIFVSILPGECLWWVTDTDAHYSEYLEEKRKTKERWLGETIIIYLFIFLKLGKYKKSVAKYKPETSQEINSCSKIRRLMFGIWYLSTSEFLNKYSEQYNFEMLIFRAQYLPWKLNFLNWETAHCWNIISSDK